MYVNGNQKTHEKNSSVETLSQDGHLELDAKSNIMEVMLDCFQHALFGWRDWHMGINQVQFINNI